ncbi:DUF418 domain-containing protein [Shewanella submarina]|uniref:DUF418 domain-containing protein n=1 Tax=Shewanella submarina TaxID=2016376 RepID=A0ABV7GA50_9GAMM|nr:DUF418 domain-containing protein [Shewanella submarina]MCL1039726.1 DUF418 domain-containing protein [Shewanella submarina]
MSGKELGTGAPTGERLKSLDIIRGFALLGLPFMNIISFAMPMSAYLNPMSWDTDNPLNYPFFAVSYLFFDQRFMGLFALLYGAGAALLCDKLRTEQGSAGGIFIRRQLWLLVIGISHAWFLWNGDILTLYAMLGFMLFPLLNLRAVNLMIIAGLCLAGAAFLGTMDGVSHEALGDAAWRDLGAFFAPDAEQLIAMKAFYQGDYQQLMHFLRGANWDGGEMATGADFVLLNWFFSVALKAFAMMCIGVALLRMGWLSGSAPVRLYQRLAFAGVGGGFALSLFGLWWNHDMGWSMSAWFSFGLVPNILASTLMSLGYLGLLCLWIGRGDGGKTLQKALANVGRMALTNYLGQSLIMALIFFGYGLGWYAQLGREALFLVAVCIGLMQIVVSGLWLAVFRQGPMEWLWRALTWWTLPPLLKRN